jgi:hypothetical protein
MKIDLFTPDSQPDPKAGKQNPAHSLLKDIENAVAGVNDVYENLGTGYETPVYPL